MDSSMAISGEKIRALRDARAWSQAHLAEVASLSLRTVQRVEAEGTASAETRMALAAALDVSVDALNAPLPAVGREPTPERVYPTAIETMALLLAFGAALVFMLWKGSQLPAQVASHFGVAGDANDHMSRDGFVALMILTTIGVPLLIRALLPLAIARGKVKIPNASYWFAASRRQATERFLYGHFTWLGIGVTAFSTWVFWLVVAANVGAPSHPALDTRASTAGMAVFLVGMTAWVTVLGLRFRRKAA